MGIITRHFFILDWVEFIYIRVLHKHKYITGMGDAGLEEAAPKELLSSLKKYIENRIMYFK